MTATVDRFKGEAGEFVGVCRVYPGVMGVVLAQLLRGQRPDPVGLEPHTYRLKRVPGVLIVGVVR